MDVRDSCSNHFFGGGEDFDRIDDYHITIIQDVQSQVSAMYTLMGVAVAVIVLAAIGCTMFTVSTLSAAVLLLVVVVTTAISILGQISNFRYDIYAKPVGDPIPRVVEATAEDDELIEKYGVHEEIIENPMIHDTTRLQVIADRRLKHSKWARYTLPCDVAGNMAHETEDTVQIYNSRTLLSHKIFVISIDNDYARGTPWITKLTGWIIL